MFSASELQRACEIEHAHANILDDGPALSKNLVNAENEPRRHEDTKESQRKPESMGRQVFLFFVNPSCLRVFVSSW